MLHCVVQARQESAGPCSLQLCAGCGMEKPAEETATVI